MTDHFIPFRLHDILRLCHEGAPGGGAFSRTTTLISLLLRQEFQDRLDRLKDLYHHMDPNADTKPVVGETSSSDPVAFSQELQGLLERANYRALTKDELDHAMTAESLFQVKLHTPLEDFRELTIYTRGKRLRQETITTWFGFKKRVIDVDYFERVLLFVRFQDAEHFARVKRTKLPFTPGTTQLKLFANVPSADLEMLFPNSEVRMKNVDKAMIGVPAAIGIATMTTKIFFVLTFLWAGLRWIGAEAGLHHDQVNIGTLAAEASLVLGAVVAIYLFIGRQLMRYRFKKIQFLQKLADNLFFRNLDNNAGAMHRVLDDAQEEDIKEAVLAYRFLADGPATEAELDARVEGWFAKRLATTLDFEVDDGLAKLERLGLATRSGATWTAVAPAQAAGILHEKWIHIVPV